MWGMPGLHSKALRRQFHIIINHFFPDLGMMGGMGGMGKFDINGST